MLGRHISGGQQVWYLFSIQNTTLSSATLSGSAQRMRSAGTGHPLRQERFGTSGEDGRPAAGVATWSGLAALVVCQRDSDKARRRASGVVVGVESLHGRTGEFGFEKPPARFSSGPPRSRLSLQSCQVREAHSTESRADHHRHRHCVLSMRGEIGSWYRRDVEIDHGLLSSMGALLFGAQAPPVCVYTVARTGLTEQ